MCTPLVDWIVDGRSIHSRCIRQTRIHGGVACTSSFNRREEDVGDPRPKSDDWYAQEMKNDLMVSLQSRVNSYGSGARGERLQLENTNNEDPHNPSETVQHREGPLLSATRKQQGRILVLLLP